MMTAMAAWMAGAHLCLQGAGTLDRINAMSFEQFLMDVEMWDHIGRIAEGARTDSIDCEADLIASLPSDFLGEDHTVEHMRREIRTPLLAPPWSYDEWMSAGSPDCAELARCLLAKARQPEEWPDMDAAVRRELDGYLASRRRTLA
jgi:trimethylamine--corrinoid protein Co-methyltransferase